MKLFRFNKSGSIGLGMVDQNGKLIDISDFKEDFNEAFFEQDGINRLTSWLIANADKCNELNEAPHYLACV